MTTTTENDLFGPAMAPGAGRNDDEVKRDRYGRYLLPHPQSGRETPWTRATTFAKTISDTYTLNMWGRRMAVKGLTMREDLYVLAASTPLTDRKTLNEIAEKAADAAGSKVGASLGTALHSFTEQNDRGEQVTAPPKYRPHVAAYVAALAEHGVEVVPAFIERIVISTTYNIAGTFDRIFRVVRDCAIELPSMEPFKLKAGALIIGDLKTGRDLSYGWLEIAVQLAVYANADLMWNADTDEYEPMPELDKRVAIVAHLPAVEPGETVQCTMYDLNVAQGWTLAGLCADVRAARKMNGLAVPRLAVTGAAFDTTANPETVVDIEDPAGWGLQIDSARTVADLSRIWREATAARQWTDALHARGMARRALISADTAGS